MSGQRQQQQEGTEREARAVAAAAETSGRRERSPRGSGGLTKTAARDHDGPSDHDDATATTAVTSAERSRSSGGSSTDQSSSSSNHTTTAARSLPGPSSASSSHRDRDRPSPFPLPPPYRPRTDQPRSNTLVSRRISLSLHSIADDEGHAANARTATATGLSPPPFDPVLPASRTTVLADSFTQAGSGAAGAGAGPLSSPLPGPVASSAAAATSSFDSLNASLMSHSIKWGDQRHLMPAGGGVSTLVTPPSRLRGLPTLASPRSPHSSLSVIRSSGEDDEGEGNNGGAGCIGGIGRSGMVRSVRRCCCSRWSFTRVFSVLMAVVLVALTAALWATNIAATTHIAHSMADVTRGALMHTITQQFGVRFSCALDSLLMLRWATDSKFPSFPSDRRVSNVTGWLAVLSTTATASPELCALGLINQHHTFMSLFKRTGSIPADPQQLSHLRVMHAEPGDGGGTDGTDVADGVCRVYSPRTVQPFPDDALRHPRKLRMSTQVRHRDSPSVIRDYLGAPIANASVPGGLVRITQTVGQDLRASGLQTMWSEPTMLNNTVTNAFTVTAFSRIEPTATRPEQLDTLGHAPVAFVAIDLASFGDLFARLQPALGASGIGFLITPRGLVVASSQQTYVRHSVFSSQPNDIAPDAPPPDDLLTLLHPLLHACGLITDQAVSNLNATELLTADDSSAVCEHSLHYRGDEFLFQASLLSQSDTALPWSVVLLTRDYDFFGSQIRRATIQMVVIALASMVVAVTLVAVIVRLLTRPIDEVAGFMADVARIASMTASDAKQAQMKDVQRRWRASDAGAGSQTDATLRARSTKSPGGGGRRVGDQSALQQAEAQTLGQRQRRIARGSCGGSFSCRTREVSLMQRSFGGLLQSWAGYDELEALNHSKRQFIRYIFHEVRVPFNAIVLGVEQLAVDLQPHAALLPDAADTIAILSEQSGVVTHILNDVLSLQKIEDGALTLDCAPFDVDRMVRSTLYSFKAPCKERKLRLKVNLDDLNAMVAAAARAACATWTWPLHLPPLCFGVLGDVHRLRQALSNYVSNAIKFSPHGRELRVLLEFSELQLDAALLSLGSHDGGRVPSEADVSALADHPLGQVLMRVTVKDEGAGIPDEHQANLFKPYMQIDAGKLQSSKGSGLGLALCKSVVELHGGSVGFESELGAGSSFFFSLPMQLCLLDAADAPSRSTRSVTAATASALTALQNAEEQTFRALITPHGEGPRSLLMRHSSTTAGVSDNALSDCMDALRPAPITVDDSPRDVRDDNVADRARAGGSSGHDDNDALSPAWPRTTSSDQGPGNSVHHRTRTELFFAPTSNSSRSSLSPGATSMEAVHLAAGMVACSNMLPLRLAHSALLPQGSGAATPLSASASASSSLTSTPILGPGKSGRPGTVIRLQKRFGYITPSLDSRRVGSVAVGSVDSAGPSAVSTPTNAVTAAEAATSTIPAEPSTLPSTPASSSFASFLPSSPRVRVLVVEDSAPNRKLLCALLTRLRCAVTAVENGQLCVDLMRPHFDTPPDTAAPLPFDIVLMDNSMPVMDGVTATRLMREGGIALPVIGVTGNALEEDIRSFMNGGATEILTKPVSTAQLSRVLQQYTHYRPTAAPSRAAPSTPVAGSRRGDAPS